MTCVVAYKHESGIYMGADSAGTAINWLSVPRFDPKIYRVSNGEDHFLFGFTTSFRMGQILGRRFVPPTRGSTAIENYMVVDFIDALRECMKAAGFAKKEHEQETSGTFLVAYCGRIFVVEDNYSVGESTWPFNAVGSGADLALGSMYTSLAAPNLLTPEHIVGHALHAAHAFNAAVRGPFVFERLDT